MVQSFATPLISEAVSRFDQQWELVELVPHPTDQPPEGRGRRLGMRIEVDLPVSVGLGLGISHCRAVELSTTGIVLHGCYPLHFGTRVVLYLSGRRGESLRLQARAIRATRRGQALEFRGLTAEQQLCIAELLDDQAFNSSGEQEYDAFSLVHRRS